MAEPTGLLDGWTGRTALAAIAVHDRAKATWDVSLIAAQAVLIMALEQSAAIAALAAYQDLLAAAVLKVVEEDPPRRIEALSLGDVS